MENIYLAQIKEDGNYVISRVPVTSKILGVNGETVVFVNKSLEHMFNALGLVIFQPGAKSSFVMTNTYFFLDRESARTWVEEMLGKTRYKSIDVDSTVYVVNEDFNLSTHKVVEIYKKDDKLGFRIENCLHVFIVLNRDINSTRIVDTIGGESFSVFSDVNDAIEHVKSNVQRKIEKLNDEYHAKMAEYTDLINKAENI